MDSMYSIDSIDQLELVRNIKFKIFENLETEAYLENTKFFWSWDNVESLFQNMSKKQINEVKDEVCYELRKDDISCEEFDTGINIEWNDDNYPNYDNSKNEFLKKTAQIVRCIQLLPELCYINIFNLWKLDAIKRKVNNYLYKIVPILKNIDLMMDMMDNNEKQKLSKQILLKLKQKLENECFTVKPDYIDNIIELNGFIISLESNCKCEGGCGANEMRNIISLDVEKRCEIYCNENIISSKILFHPFLIQLVLIQ